MLFINPKNEYPRHLGDLLAEHSEWQDGDELPDGWKQVAYAENLPEAGENQVRVEVFPSMQNGVLTQTFIIRDLTEEELANREARLSLKQKLDSLQLTPVEKTILGLYLVK